MRMCRLGFGRHGALMNGGCRLHARGIPEKIFKFVFTPSSRASANPCCTDCSRLRDSLSSMSLRHLTPWQMNVQIYTYVNSDEIYPTALPLVILPIQFLHSFYLPPFLSFLYALSHADLLSLCLILLSTYRLCPFFLCFFIKGEAPLHNSRLLDELS